MQSHGQLDELKARVQGSALVHQLAQRDSPPSLTFLLRDGEVEQAVAMEIRDAWVRVFFPYLSGRQLFIADVNKLWFNFGRSQLGRVFATSGQLWFELGLPLSAVDGPCLDYTFRRALAWTAADAVSAGQRRGTIPRKQLEALLHAPALEGAHLRDASSFEHALKEAGEQALWSEEEGAWQLGIVNERYPIKARWQENAACVELRCDLSALQYTSPPDGLAGQVFAFHEFLGAARLVHEGDTPQASDARSEMFAALLGSAAPTAAPPPLSLRLDVPRFEGLELEPWLFRLRDDADAVLALLSAQGVPIGEALRAEMAWLERASLSEGVTDDQLFAALLAKLEGKESESLGRSIRWRIFLNMAAGLLRAFGRQKPELLARLSMQHGDKSIATRSVALFRELAALLP